MRKMSFQSVNVCPLTRTKLKNDDGAYKWKWEIRLPVHFQR